LTAAHNSKAAQASVAVESTAMTMLVVCSDEQRIDTRFLHGAIDSAVLIRRL
jgi:hypothetical protein